MLPFLLSLLSLLSLSHSSPSLGGAIGCIVTNNKLYSHGNYIRQLTRSESGQIVKYRKEMAKFKKMIDEAFTNADFNEKSNSTLPVMPTRPAMPAFCSGKDTILYIFAGCTVQNNKVYIGKTLARELDAAERKKLTEFTEKVAANQAAIQKAKRRVRQRNDAGFDTATAAQLAEAITYGSPLNGTSTYLCNLNGTPKPSTGIPNINQYSFFEFDGSSLRARKHYAIGTGIVRPFSSLQPMASKLEILYAGGHQGGPFFWYSPSTRMPKGTPPSVAKREEDEGTEAEDGVWRCTFDGCTSVFLSFTNLDAHVMRGNHSLAPKKETITDVALGLFAARVETVGSLQGRIATDEVMDLIYGRNTTLLEHGWAQKSTQRSSLNPDAKLFVEETVRKCRVEESRADAKRIVQKMRAAKSGGKFRFTPSTMLTQKQVQGVINRCLLKLRDGKVDEVEAEKMDGAEAWRAVEKCGVREEEEERELQRDVSEVVPKKKLRK